MKLRFWYMVHAKSDLCPSIADICNSLLPPLAGARIQLDHGNEDQWQRLLLFSSATVLSSFPVLSLSRYFPGDQEFLWSREGMIDELRSKLSGPDSDRVFDHLQQVSQSFSIVPCRSNIGPAKLARICEQTCGYLAEATDGLIQVFQEGFFNRDHYCPVNEQFSIHN